MLATVNHQTDVTIDSLGVYNLQNKAQAEEIEMQHVDEAINDGFDLYNVRRNSNAERREKEIESSTIDMRIEANALKEISRRIKVEDLQFSILDFPDDKFYSVVHKLLDREQVKKKFKYTTKNKADVQMSILEYLNEMRRTYNIPEAFVSWDSVSDIVQNKIEEALKNAI